MFKVLFFSLQSLDFVSQMYKYQPTWKQKALQKTTKMSLFTDFLPFCNYYLVSTLSDAWTFSHLLKVTLFTYLHIFTKCLKIFFTKQNFYLVIVFFTRFPQFPANMLWTMALQCLLTVHTWVKCFKFTVTKKEINVHRRIYFFYESISPMLSLENFIG